MGERYGAPEGREYHTGLDEEPPSWRRESRMVPNSLSNHRPYYARSPEHDQVRLPPLSTLHNANPDEGGDSNVDGAKTSDTGRSFYR